MMCIHMLGLHNVDRRAESNYRGAQQVPDTGNKSIEKDSG